jgi:hypothetical protein
LPSFPQADLSPIKDYFDSIHKTWMFGHILHKAFSGKLDFYLSIRPEMFRHCFFRHILFSILEEGGLDLSQKEEILNLLSVNKEIREIIVGLLKRIKYYKELEGILQKSIQSFSEEPRPLSDEELNKESAELFLKWLEWVDETYYLRRYAKRMLLKKLDKKELKNGGMKKR